MRKLRLIGSALFLFLLTVFSYHILKITLGKQGEARARGIQSEMDKSSQIRKNEEMEHNKKVYSRAFAFNETEVLNEATKAIKRECPEERDLGNPRFTALLIPNCEGIPTKTVIVEFPEVTRACRTGIWSLVKKEDAGFQYIDHNTPPTPGEIKNMDQAMDKIWRDQFWNCGGD